MKKSFYKFAKDLPVAKRTEQQVRRFLEYKYGVTYLGSSDCLKGVSLSDFDLRMVTPSGRIMDIEIKEDFLCRKTGNVCVEYECRGAASGIAISKANYFLYKIHLPDSSVGVYIIDTAELKKMVAMKMYSREVVGGDFGSNTKSYLFKLEVVKEYFTFLGTLPN